MLVHPGIILAASQFLESEINGYVVNGKGEIFGRNGKKFKPTKNYRNGGGYDLRIGIQLNGKRKFLVIQRIMCHVFYGMPLDSKMQGNHLDRKTYNNNLWNIEMTTQSENQKHWREDEKRKRVKPY